jgi:hypothetical protein
MNEMEPSRGAVRVSKLILITALLVVLVTLGAAQVSSAEGTHPDNATSTPLWYSLVKDSFIGSPGHIPEVLSGTANVPLDVSVPEHTWSSAALMSATVPGILGLNPDVPHNKLRFQPHLPPRLNTVGIRNFHFGSRTLQFTLQRSSSEIELSVANNGKPFELEFVPQLLFSGDRARGSKWKRSSSSLDAGGTRQACLSVFHNSAW